MRSLRVIEGNPAPPATDQVAATWQRSLTRLRTMRTELHLFKEMAGPIAAAGVADLEATIDAAIELLVSIRDGKPRT